MANDALNDKLKAIDSNRSIILRRQDAFLPFESRRLDNYYRIELTYTSNAIEGNTMSRVETKILLEDGVTPEGKKTWEAREALGHSDAFSLMLEMVRHGRIDTITATVLKLHSLFYRMIDWENAGVFRDGPVYLAGSARVPPKASLAPEMMIEFDKEFNEKSQYLHPLKLAAFAHLRLVNIHPFVDGNGRVARLLMNLVLLKNNYQLVSISPEDREKYIKSIEATHNFELEASEPMLFYHFIADCELKSQKHLMRVLERVGQLDTVNN
ncbi:MAG: Fic family protein [Deltaproteobacteria bacterium]|jgi:Fic family protein|nr:Fic family protein [Deltaproteobacteria bacterium]